MSVCLSQIFARMTDNGQTKIATKEKIYLIASFHWGWKASTSGYPSHFCHFLWRLEFLCLKKRDGQRKKCKYFKGVLTNLVVVSAMSERLGVTSAQPVDIWARPQWRSVRPSSRAELRRHGVALTQAVWPAALWKRHSIEEKFGPGMFCPNYSPSWGLFPSPRLKSLLTSSSCDCKAPLPAPSPSSSALFAPFAISTE